MTIDSTAMDIANVRANTVEKGFVLGGGGVGVLSNGATNPTAAPVVSNYYNTWLATFSGGTPNGSQDVSGFFAGMDEYLADTTKWVASSIFFGTQIRVFNKTDGQLGAFPDPTNGKSWSSQFYGWGGIAQDGVDYWIIGSDNNRSVDIYLYAINGTTYNKDAELRIGASNAFHGFHPRVVADKVNHRVGMVWTDGAGALNLRWYRVSGGSIVQVGSDIVLKTGVGTQSVGDAWFGDCGTGLGAGTLFVALQGDGATLPNVMCWSSVSTTAATRNTTNDWKKPDGADIYAMGYNAATGHFQVMDKFARVRESSAIGAVSASSLAVTARTTYYDSDTGNYAGSPGSGTVIINGTDVSGTASTAHETGYSPTASFTSARRAWVRITSASPAPDVNNLDATKVDRANKIGFYTAIGGGTMWRQAYGTVGQVTVDSFDAFPTTGTPDAHTFATAQVSLGVFESANTRLDGTPKWYLDGAGTAANIDGLIPPGTIITGMWMFAPPGYVACDGAAISRAGNPDLFNAICPTFTATSTNLSTSITGVPAAVVSAIAGAGTCRITGPGLPTTGTTTVASGSGTTLTVSAAATTALGAGTGVFRVYPCGVGDGSTTFNTPNLVGKQMTGLGALNGIGSSGGNILISLTTAQLPAHQHSIGLQFASTTTTGGTAIRVTDINNQTGGGGTAATGNTGNTGSGSLIDARDPFLSVSVAIKL
jgi:microcystin-dependent protein